MKKQKSPGWNIDTIGLKKVGKGAWIAAAGAALTYLMGAIPGIDFGMYTPVVVGISSIVINFLRKWIVSYE